MARKKRVKKNEQNRKGIIMVLAILVFMMLVVSISKYKLNTKLASYREKEKMLMEQIEEEQKRTEEIEEFRKYTKTKKYIEEIAREKLGLVYEDEIIIQTDED